MFFDKKKNIFLTPTLLWQFLSPVQASPTVLLPSVYCQSHRMRIHTADLSKAGPEECILQLLQFFSLSLLFLLKSVTCWSQDQVRLFYHRKQSGVVQILRSVHHQIPDNRQIHFHWQKETARSVHIRRRMPRWNDNFPRHTWVVITRSSGAFSRARLFSRRYFSASSSRLTESSCLASQ